MTDDETPEDVLESLARLPTLAHPTASNDGQEVALYYDITGRNELHVVDVDSGRMAQWSDGEVPRNARWWVDWASDGEEVFFHLDDDGNEQNDIHAISRDGETESLIEMDGQAMLTDVGEDGKTLLVGSSRDGQMNLYRHHLGGETEKITDYERAAWGGVLSPDCERVAYGTNETDDYENMDVYVANADGSDPRNLEIGETGAEAVATDWGPEGERLLVGDNSTDLGRLGIYDLAAETVEWLGDGEFEETPTAFLPDGGHVIGIRSRDAADVPVVYDLDTGEGREFDLPDGVATFGNANPVLDENRVVLTHTTPTQRPELLVYDVSTHEYETLVEAEYGPFDPEDFADAEYFTFESDGVPETRQAAVEHEPYAELEIEALFYDSGARPSPLIVNPHGGPRHRDTRRFDLYTQVLVSLGFSVLQVNYRGSTGRGREFVEELYDDWGGAEQGDVAVAAEHIIETYDWIDTDRIVVFGGSYGGYSAYWQMVQYPDLYDAGVAWIGLTDLEDMFENTMPHFRTELMQKNLGTPEENPDLYRERSPVAHVENISAPIFVVHGVNDRRVPVSQARIFREALEDAGYEEGTDGDFEYRELGEEGHASSDQDQKLRMFEALAEFLERRVGTEPEVAAHT